MLCRMRRVRTLLALLGLAVAPAGCSPAIDVQRVGPAYPPLPADCHVRLFRSAERLGPTCTRIGSVAVRDTGFTTNCGSDRVRREIRRTTCEMGGHAAVLQRVSGVASTCVQADAEIYRCEPEVAAPRESGSSETPPE